MDRPEVIIEAGRSERRYWRDLWEYRELFYFLAWRDILVRYKQTAIGVAWAVLRPLLTMTVFTIIFHRLARLPSGDVPYPVLVAAAILPWQFFSSAVAEAGNSLVENSNLLTKVYFPRIIVPASAVITSLADFLVSGFILAAVMAWFSVAPGWALLLVPVFTLQACAAAVGVGLFLSALNVRYRDFRYALPFLLQIGLYVSPVGFLSSLVPEEWRLWYAINPMVGVIDGFRWAVAGVQPDLGMLTVSALSAVTLLTAGITYFRRVERSLADLM